MEGGHEGIGGRRQIKKKANRMQADIKQFRDSARGRACAIWDAIECPQGAA